MGAPITKTQLLVSRRFPAAEAHSTKAARGGYPRRSTHFRADLNNFMCGAVLERSQLQGWIFQKGDDSTLADVYHRRGFGQPEVSATADVDQG